MKTSLLSLFAGTVFLAGAAGASAGEPVTLAAADLDAISAGNPGASATAVAVGAAAVNIADVDQYIRISVKQADDVNITATNASSIVQTASATNSGAVTAAASATNH